jgi:signal transduction histidine kinase
MAADVLAGVGTEATGHLEIAPITCANTVAGALLWESSPTARPISRALAQHSAAMLAAPVAMAALAERNLSGHRALAGAAERRLARLGLDLHDGALQSLALLRGEIAAFNTQIGESGADPRLMRLVRGRTQDLAAMAELLEAELRELATSLETPTLVRRPFPEVLDGVVRAFAQRTGIEPSVELRCAEDRITESQRIALLRIVQEALSNARAHSRASSVRIRIESDHGGITAVIDDDGKGFDVSAALHGGGRRGRIGLLGMIERARLLGGRCTINSAPGVGTAVQVYVPRVAASAPVAAAPVQGAA